MEKTSRHNFAATWTATGGDDGGWWWRADQRRNKRSIGEVKWWRGSSANPCATDNAARPRGVAVTGTSGLFVVSAVSSWWPAPWWAARDRVPGCPIKVFLGRWQVGSAQLKDFLIFKTIQTCKIQIQCLLEVQNYLNFAWGFIWTWWTTLSIGPTSHSQQNSCYKFWNRFKFESSLKFKGVKTLWKKSGKFTENLSGLGIHKSEFSWVHLYARFWSYNTSVKRLDLKIRKEFEFQIQTTQHL
jgi:hypothetical protein